MNDLYEDLKIPADLDAKRDRNRSRAIPPAFEPRPCKWLERPGNPLGPDSDSFGYEAEDWGE